MPGSSRRRGAVRKTQKGNPTAGSGGRRRRGLQGKGPTPRADERPHHKAYQSDGGSGRDGGRAKNPPRRPAEAGTEWVAGRNAVVELLRSGTPVDGLRVASGLTGGGGDDRIVEIFRRAAETGIGLAEAGRGELDRLTDGAAHQGVAARVTPYVYAHPDDLLDLAAERDEAPLVVVLDQVTDPRNLGAVVRSAAGFGAHGVVIAERRSAQMTAAAWKTSAGAAARLPVARTTNLTRQIVAYQKAGLMAVGLAADGEIALPELTLGDGPLVLVVGSEGAGLSRLVAETCDQRVSIPMASGLESLNAGVAAGIALYAIARARTPPSSAS